MVADLLVFDHAGFFFNDLGMQPPADSSDILSTRPTPMSHPQAISNHDPIDSTTRTMKLAMQAARRGAADACEAAARTWTATGRVREPIGLHHLLHHRVRGGLSHGFAGSFRPREQRRGPRLDRRRCTPRIRRSKGCVTKRPRLAGRSRCTGPLAGVRPSGLFRPCLPPCALHANE